MALRDLKSTLKSSIDSQSSYNTVKGILGGNTPGFTGKYHFMEIHPSDFARKMHLAVRDALRLHFARTPQQYQAYLTQHRSKLSVSTFVTAINDVMNTFTQAHIAPGNTTRFYSSNICRNMYLDSQQANTFLVYAGSNIYDRGARFRKEVFKQWKVNTGHTTLSRVSARDRDLDVTHDPSTTVWVGLVELRTEQIAAQLDIKVTEFDLVQAVLDNLGIVWEEQIVDDNQSVGQKRIMKVALGPDNIRNLLDANGINRFLTAITKTQFDIIFSKFLWMHPRKAWKAVASVPFRQQAAAAIEYQALRLLMSKGTKAGWKVKGKKPIKPKRAPRGGPLKQPKGLRKGKRKKVTLPEKITVTAKTERGQGNEADTATAADLAKLKGYINSRLPAEIQRNMGRPALRFRTGRFAGSAEVLSLHQAQKTIVAKYSYLLSPYQTFENTGRKRWPLAYNPKPLIAKSIRNLAKGRIESKLTVRRV